MKKQKQAPILGKKRRGLTGNMVTLLMVAVLYIVVAVMIYSGAASRQMTSMVISISCYIVMAVSLNLVVGLLGVAGVAGLYYISRTGNSVNSVSSLELMLRNTLEQKLMARPRTKEFLIGVPCLMWFIWLSCRRWKLLPFFVGLGMAIGLTSFVNTFLHLRSPLILSFARTGYAVLFGLVIGAAGIALLEIVRVVRRREKSKRV